MTMQPLLPNGDRRRTSNFHGVVKWNFEDKNSQKHWYDHHLLPKLDVVKNASGEALVKKVKRKVEKQIKEYIDVMRGEYRARESSDEEQEQEEEIVERDEEAENEELEDDELGGGSDSKDGSCDSGVEI